MQSEKKIVVLTPVKNESWILPIFCKSTSIWADYIIIADQNSTDGSREIALRFPKVVVIDNNSPNLDENYRDKILLDKARELVGNNGILFRIDADEIFTPNYNSSNWDRIKKSKSGTVWKFRLIQLNRNLSSYWENANSTTYGAFVDDGRDYSTHGIIHSRDMFQPKNSYDICTPNEILLLHFQFVDWNRMRSKHRWYQCFERIRFQNKSAIDIYRTYHWMYNPSIIYNTIPNEWIKTYKEKYGININDIVYESHYWWDDIIKEYFQKYSPKYFRHIETYKTTQELLMGRDKTIVDKLLLCYLCCTTNAYNKQYGILYKMIQKTDAGLKRIFKI